MQMQSNVKRNVWWQNTRTAQDYAIQHDSGYIWARQATSGNSETGYRKNLMLLRRGDIVIHYDAAHQVITAVSLVLKEYEISAKPYIYIEKPNDDKGYKVSVRYSDLEVPISRAELNARVPDPLRYRDAGPFQRKNDHILGGFLFHLSDRFVEKLVWEFPAELHGTPLGK